MRYDRFQFLSILSVPTSPISPPSILSIARLPVSIPGWCWDPSQSILVDANRVIASPRSPFASPYRPRFQQVGLCPPIQVPKRWIGAGIWSISLFLWLLIFDRLDPSGRNGCSSLWVCAKFRSFRCFVFDLGPIAWLVRGLRWWIAGGW